MPLRVTINQKALRRILGGHPWIFRSDLEKIEASGPGPVSVFSTQGKLLGQALYSPQSQIALRMMTRGEEKITASLIHERIAKALALRKKYFPNSKIYRAVFGESDGLPSLIVDRFEQVVVFQSLSAGLEVFKEKIVESLQQLEQPCSIVERNDSSVRLKEGLEKIVQVVRGQDFKTVEISVAGYRYQISPLHGQKTGFFLDQRINAITTGRYLSGDILDVFCNSGQFSFQASPRARHLTCVDFSQEVIDQLDNNAHLNGIHDLTLHRANGFDFLKDADQAKKSYDGIVLDPPAFVKSKASLGAAHRGYKEINLRAMRLLRPGGILATFSCSQNLAAETWLQILHQAALDAKRTVRVLELLHQPPDHPWTLGIPETRYLKGAILEVGASA